MRECYDEFGQNILRLTQWDLNRVVTIQDFEYEETPIVHFAHINDEKSLVVTGDDVTLVDGELKVKIPNELLLTSESILMNIFVYNRETNKGINVENILLPVQPKPQPNDYVYVDNVDVVELSTLKLSLQTAITNAQTSVNAAISSLEQQYQAAQQGLATQLNTAKTELENQVNNALRDTLENIKDGTPKGIFSNESDLANKEAGIYIFYNANDNVDDNGYLFYWDGENLSNRLFLYNGISIGDGEITLEMISTALKYAAIEDYRIFESMADANEYLTTNYAKAGQTIKVKENGKYKLYLIQSNDSTLSLSQISANSVIDDRLPTVAEADADTDYYINQNGSYVHYRLIGGSFVAVGGDSYSKTEVTEMLDAIREDVTANGSTLTELTGMVADLSRELDSKEGYSYRLEYGKYLIKPDDPEETDNVLRLVQYAPDGTDSVVSFFVIQGGGGGGTASTNLVVEKITNSPLTVLYGNKVEIAISYSSTDEDGDPVDGTFELKVGSSVVKTGALSQGVNTFDITNNCVVGSQKVTLNVTDEGGNSSVKTWTVQVIDVSIDSTFSDNVIRQVGQALNFTYTPYGTINKKVHFVLDGVEIDTFETTATGIQQTFVIPPQEYGSHLLDCYITAIINGTEVKTNHIYKDIMYYDGVDDTPIISCIYRNDYHDNVKIKQYDTFPIDYIAYDPKTTTPTVTISIDGNVVETLKLPSSAGTYAFSTDKIGTHTVVITCGETSKTIKIDVEDLGINVGIVQNNLGFDFNPVGFSNSSPNRLWKYDKDNNIQLSVSDDFDWTNGGYQIDDEGHQYFCIKAGTRAYISYRLFGDREAFVNGTAFKLIYKTANVRKANATFLKCVSQDENDNVGLVMNVHEAYLSSSGDSLYMPYSENDRIELEYNINPIETDVDDYNNIIPKEGAETYVMSYEDGVGFRPMIYDSSHRFYQYEPENIEIGSDDCDVYIYRMRAYTSSLTESQIKDNFIADAPDADEMIKRYNRNQIYNDAGNLTPESVADACPNLKVILIEAPYFTNDKKDFVKNTKVQCIHRGGDPVLDNWTLTKGYHAGQGTTSNEYGYAARNLDLIFNCDGINPPNDKIKPEEGYISEVQFNGDDKVYKFDGKKYTNVSQDKNGDDVLTSKELTLTRNSVGTYWFNIKVNVASSEMANNALLQKRYNDYIPYTSLAQQRDEKIKNDMEFVNCVVFIRETDPDGSTHREHPDDNWHFYSLGNIGDSKKTDYTRAYDQDDMNEFTLEISDNTLNNSTFQSGVYLGVNGERVVEAEKDLTAHEYIYPILPSEWNNRNKRYLTLYADSFDGDSSFPVYDKQGNPTYNDKSEQVFASGSFELRYGCKGDFKDGKLVNKTTENQKQLLINADVWRAFYRWVITSTDAEFIREFEQWCTKDAMLYWYNFTHHFTMIDNRAKNTFWHFARTGKFREMTKPVKELLHIYCELIDGHYVRTTDTEINPNKKYYSEYQFDMLDYDNDTAIGINNSGELTMTYGKEDVDYKIDLMPSSGWLYNGADSAFWCRIRNLMATDLDVAYQSINPNCWSATNIINEFDNWQNQFPEELWRLHYEQLYIRTYQGGGLNGGKEASPTPRFLKEMMNGRKKYQRRQWVRDQEDYFGTKHLTSNITSDQIMFRCNTPTGADVVVAPDYTLQLVPYSDMYLSVKFGNTGAKQIRAKAGELVRVDCPFSTMDDTAVLIYCASKIQEINDLSACYIHDNDFSKATRLQRLVIGNNTDGYKNTFLTTLSMGNNALLEFLDIRNCPNLTGSLNLSQLNLLQTLLADGTKITGVIFANNGKISTAHLPASLQSLTIRNLLYLNDLHFAGLDNLSNLIIQNTDVVDSISIVRDTADTLRTLNLTGVSYDLETESGWYLGTGDDLPTYNADIVGTDAPSLLLETLYQLSQRRDYNINIEGDVYVPTIKQKYIDKYAAQWGNLNIHYRLLIEQKQLTFLNADGKTLFVEYVDGGMPFQVKTYNPVGVDIEIPTLEPTKQYVFTFDHWEKYENGNATGEVYEFGKTLSDNETVIAVYSTTTREYTVRWFADTDKKQILLAKSVPYGSEVKLEDFADDPNYTPLEPLQSNVQTQNGVTFGKYKFFEGWDKSTANIIDDIDVCAKWEETREFTKNGSTGMYDIGKTDLADMTKAEIYAISNAKQWEKFFGSAQGEKLPFIMGTDLSYDNVDELEIVSVDSPLRLDTKTFQPRFVTDKDGNPVKLFGKDSPSFTFVVDFKFLPKNTNGDANDDNTMVISALENFNQGNEGFAIQKVTSSNVSNGSLLWGDKTLRVSYLNQRDICVIRHKAGTNDLIIHSFNANPPSQQTVTSLDSVTSPDINTHYYCSGDGKHYIYRYNKFVQIGEDTVSNGRIRTGVTADTYYDSTTKYVRTRTVKVNPSDENGIPLVIGGYSQYNQDTNEYEIVTGKTPNAMIFWCKLWFDDLGEEAGFDLASWTRNKVVAQYYHGLIDSGTTYGCPYYTTEQDDEGNYKRGNAAFVFNQELDLGHSMNINNTNAGGWNASLMRTFGNHRIYDGLPKWLKRLIKTARVKSYSASGIITQSLDNVFLPTEYEIDGSTNSGEVNNNARIPWLTTVDSRLHWRGLEVDFSYAFASNKAVKYTGSANPVATYGLYGESTKPDGTPKDPNTGVKFGETWKTTANSTNQTGYMWIPLDKYRELGLTGGTAFSVYDEATEKSTIYGYWIAAAIAWLRGMDTGYTSLFYFVYSSGYVRNNYDASNIYGVFPCFII